MVVVDCWLLVVDECKSNLTYDNASTAVIMT